MKVLFLEDVLLTCNMLGAIMECMFPADTMIACSMSCSEFTEIFMITEPDIVLIDFLLPDKDGVECFADLYDTTELPPNYPVIYYSGVPRNVLTKKINEYYTEHNIKHTNYTILSKPFSLEEFYEAFHEVMDATYRVTYDKISQSDFLKRIDGMTK